MTVGMRLVDPREFDWQVLEVLARCDRERRPAPSLRELMAALDTKSDRAISAALDRLEQSGYIRREPRKARAIVILKTK